jgi:hypothetical protein
LVVEEVAPFLHEGVVVEDFEGFAGGVEVGFLPSGVARVAIAIAGMAAGEFEFAETPRSLSEKSWISMAV